MPHLQSVLLVESDPMLRSFVLQKLADRSCDVDVANDAEEARVLQQARHYDLILKDLPNPFSLDVLEWHLKRVSWQPTPKPLRASA